jgi:Mg-chelatase subunit ChlD
MTATWIRREFGSTGLTQYPVGAHLKAMQARMGGSVVLCIDVSGSMAGGRLGQAVKGAKKFLEEATDASYQVGLVLWNHQVQRSVAVSDGVVKVRAGLTAARSSGGTNVVPALFEAESLLADRDGDLVVAIFGDGDLGDREGAIKQARAMRAKNIRILTCGLDGSSAKSLDEISSEDRDRPRSAADGDVAGAVAGLVSGLRKR